MMDIRLVAYFVLASWICHVQSAKPVVNRLICQNAFTAYSYDRLDECVNQWAQSPWIQHSNDSSIDCKFCKLAATLSWDDKLSPFICNFWKDQSECNKILISLSKLRGHENRDIMLCNILSVCNSHGYFKDLDFDSDLCSDCKKIVEDVKQLIGDNATSQEIAKKLNQYICENLPGGVKDYCEKMVNVHVPAFIHCVEAKMDPMTICSIVGLCQQTKTSMKLEDFIPSPKIESVKQPKCPGKCPKQSSFSWISRPPVPGNQMWTSKISSDTPSCDSCKDVFKQVQSVLQDRKMQSEIKGIIDDKICANMGFLKHECTSLINHNFDTILNALLQLNPQEACAIFKMCPKTRTPTIIHEILKPIHQVDIPIPGVCRLCEVIVRKLFDMLAANQTEESLYVGMKAMCDVLPSNYKNECTEFVKKYGVQIVKAIVEGTAPALICASFGLCSEPPVPILSVIQPVQSTVDFCTSCKFAVETIYLQLRNNKTEEEIRNALDQLCGLLPAQYTDQCKEYVNAYLDIVIQYMESNLTPEQVCQLLKLCPDSLKAESLSEKNPCLFGPQYWCSNHFTAKRCGATHYCSKYQGHIYRRSPNQPQPLCQYMDLPTICVNFDLAKECERVQDCVAFKLKRYLDLILEPFEPLQNCSVCEHIATRWRLQSRILGGPIVNSSMCNEYQGSKRQQCKLVHEKHDQILSDLRRGSGEPEDICARTIRCKSTPSLSSTPNDRKSLYPEDFYDKSFNPLYGSSPNEAENYFGSLDKIVNQEITSPSPSFVPIHSIKGPLVGVDPCTWGPTYWCLSYENAKKCPNALEHCKTNVWLNGIPDMEIPTQSSETGGKPQKIGPNSMNPIHCCRSANTARHCGPEALKFCMQHVWSNVGKNKVN